MTLPAAADVIATHDRLLRSGGWPVTEPAPRDTGLWLWIQTNHRFNCLLWAEEDLARRTQVGAAEIAANKRAIDRFNQARNDATERVDELLLTTLGLVDPASARTDAPVSTVAAGSRLNSETAGSMIDRLSILALKMHAMRAQTERRDVDDGAPQSSRAKLGAPAAAARRPGGLPRRVARPTVAPAARTSRSIASSRCTTIRASTRRWCPSSSEAH